MNDTEARAEVDKAMAALDYGADDARWRPGETAVDALIRERNEAQAALAVVSERAREYISACNRIEERSPSPIRQEDALLAALDAAKNADFAAYESLAEELTLIDNILAGYDIEAAPEDCVMRVAARVELLRQMWSHLKDEHDQVIEQRNNARDALFTLVDVAIDVVHHFGPLDAEGVATLNAAISANTLTLARQAQARVFREAADWVDGTGYRELLRARADEIERGEP